VNNEWISPEYFRAVGMTLVAGREFQQSDAVNTPLVTIVNETTARHYFGRENPLGRLIFFPKRDAQGRYIPFPARLSREDGHEIVGVVRDARDMNLRQPARKMAFLALGQRDESSQAYFNSSGALGALHLRLSGQPAVVAAEVRGLMKQIHPGLSIRRMSMLDDDIERSTMGRELMMTRLVGFFGLLALLLACVGLYGVMAYTVARRTAEIGLRVALGASRTHVGGMVMRQAAVLVVAGVAIGIPAALGTTRLIESLLFGLEPTDPATIALVAVVLVVVTGAA